MLSWLARYFRYLFGFLNTHDSPRQLALGCAFGVLIGLLPKGNLLAICIASLFFMLRVNLSVGMLVAVLLSFVAGYLDPLAHRIGFALLDSAALRPLWTELFNLPIVPWTRFSNTVVLGNLVIGLSCFYPVYLASVPLFTGWQSYRQRRAANRNRTKSPDAAVPTATRMAWRRRQFAELVAEIESLSRYGRAA